MIALAGWSMQHRIVVAGSKGVDMMIELHRRGFFQAAATGNCGRPAGQCDVALIDSQLRTLPDLETTLHWLAILAPIEVLVAWLAAQKPAASQSLRASREKRDFIIEPATVHERGRASRRGAGKTIRCNRRRNIHRRGNGGRRDPMQGSGRSHRRISNRRSTWPSRTRDARLFANG
jgi:hypothetical protein